MKLTHQETYYFTEDQILQLMEAAAMSQATIIPGTGRVILARDNSHPGGISISVHFDNARVSPGSSKDPRLPAIAQMLTHSTAHFEPPCNSPAHWSDLP